MMNLLGGVLSDCRSLRRKSRRFARLGGTVKVIRRSLSDFHSRVLLSGSHASRIWATLSAGLMLLPIPATFPEVIWSPTCLSARLKSVRVVVSLPSGLTVARPSLHQRITVTLFRRGVLLVRRTTRIVTVSMSSFCRVLISHNVLAPPASPSSSPSRLVLTRLQVSLRRTGSNSLGPVSRL